MPAKQANKKGVPIGASRTTRTACNKSGAKKILNYVGGTLVVEFKEEKHGVGQIAVHLLIHCSADSSSRVVAAYIEPDVP